MNRITAYLIVAIVAVVIGCEKKPEAPASSGTTESSKAPSKPATPKSEEPAHAAGGHHGAVIELGDTTIGGFSVRASRDEGELKPGGDSPIDLWVDGGLGNAAVVRFWIGTEDAKGSIKAKADVEDGHWHTHAEVPNPFPPDSMLWVEIEGKDGKKSLVSFDLKK